MTVFPLISIGSGLIFVSKDRVYPRGAGNFAFVPYLERFDLATKSERGKHSSLFVWQQIKKSFATLTKVQLYLISLCHIFNLGVN